MKKTAVFTSFSQTHMSSWTESRLTNSSSGLNSDLIKVKHVIPEKIMSVSKQHAFLLQQIFGFFFFNNLIIIIIIRKFNYRNNLSLY